MVPEEGYVMHHRFCLAMARWSKTNTSALGSQPLPCHDDSPSDQSMHGYARGIGLEMPMTTDVIAESLRSGGEPVTLNAVQKGAVA
jgi:hypothetical protein